MNIIKGTVSLIFLMTSFMATSHTMDDEYSLEKLDAKITITQGIAGQVMFWQGDFMPTIGDDDTQSGKQTLVSRVIYIYPAVKENEAQGLVKVGAPFYSKINHDPIKKIESDENGFFQTCLSPGLYSIFIREGDAFYANGFGANGVIYPIEVKTDEVTTFQFDISYQATY